nr:NUDIX domain-containing protein [Paenibacillus sp. DMB20]
MKIIVTAGAIIRDNQGRILLQKRSDYGNWGLPGGGMEPGETIEATMIREVLEETGLEVLKYHFYAVYSGERMQYTYPDGNEVVFVMFLFNAEVDLQGKVGEDGQILLYNDASNESLQLKFIDMEDIHISDLSSVQRPVFEDLKANKKNTIKNMTCR